MEAMLAVVPRVLTFVLVLVGVTAMGFASLGLLRLPDLYSRLHAVSSARTIGVGALLLSVAAYDWSVETLAKMLALIVFFLLTTPVAAHLLGQAIYLSGARRGGISRSEEAADRRLPPRRRSS